VKEVEGRGGGSKVGGENFGAEKGAEKSIWQGKRMCFWFISKMA